MSCSPQQHYNISTHITHAHKVLTPMSPTHNYTHQNPTGNNNLFHRVTWFGWGGFGTHQQKCQVVCKRNHACNLSTWRSGGPHYNTQQVGVHGYFQATKLARASSTCCRVGSAGIAPLCVTVRAPQTFANFRASLNRPSSCFSHKGNMSGFKAPLHMYAWVAN